MDYSLSTQWRIARRMLPNQCHTSVFLNRTVNHARAKGSPRKQMLTLLDHNKGLFFPPPCFLSPSLCLTHKKRPMDSKPGRKLMSEHKVHWRRTSCLRLFISQQQRLIILVYTWHPSDATKEMDHCSAPSLLSEADDGDEEAKKKKKDENKQTWSPSRM